MLVNRDNGQRLAEDVRAADSFWKRLCGLMFARSFPQDAALHLEPCRAIHTWFMRFPIDVLYLDREQIIVAAEERMEPGKMSGPVREAVSVLELPAGTIRRTGTKVGQAVGFH